MTGTKKICKFREKWYSPPLVPVSNFELLTSSPLASPAAALFILLMHPLMLPENASTNNLVF